MRGRKIKGTYNGLKTIGNEKDKILKINRIEQIKLKGKGEQKE